METALETFQRCSENNEFRELGNLEAWELGNSEIRKLGNKVATFAVLRAMPAVHLGNCWQPPGALESSLLLTAAR